MPITFRIPIGSVQEYNTLPEDSVLYLWPGTLPNQLTIGKNRVPYPSQTNIRII